VIGKRILIVKRLFLQSGSEKLYKNWI